MQFWPVRPRAKTLFDTQIFLFRHSTLQNTLVVPRVTTQPTQFPGEPRRPRPVFSYPRVICVRLARRKRCLLRRGDRKVANGVPVVRLSESRSQTELVIEFRLLNRLIISVDTLSQYRHLVSVSSDIVTQCYYLSSQLPRPAWHRRANLRYVQEQLEILSTCNSFALGCTWIPFRRHRCRRLYRAVTSAKNGNRTLFISPTQRRNHQD